MVTGKKQRPPRPSPEREGQAGSRVGGAQPLALSCPRPRRARQTFLWRRVRWMKSLTRRLLLAGEGAGTARSTQRRQPPPQSKELLRLRSAPLRRRRCLQEPRNSLPLLLRRAKALSPAFPPPLDFLPRNRANSRRRPLPRRGLCRLQRKAEASRPPRAASQASVKERCIDSGAGKALTARVFWGLFHRRRQRSSASVGRRF